MGFCKLLAKMISWIFVMTLLLGCGGTRMSTVPTGAIGANPGVAQSHFTDPFAYCAALGTVDNPDARYTGPKMPEAIIKGLTRKGVVSADAPREFNENAIWRCMDGKVLACHFGANIPCLEKASLSRTPTSAMEEFCRTDPNADNIPAAVAGRATVYQWRCTSGKPEVVKQFFKPDKQGFLSDFWYEITTE